MAQSWQAVRRYIFAYDFMFKYLEIVFASGEVSHKDAKRVEITSTVLLGHFIV